MKSILEHLTDLPEPYRSKAIDNHRRDSEKTGYALGSGPALSEPHLALALAFVWDDTPEGEFFWKAVASALSDGTPVEELELLNDQDETRFFKGCLNGLLITIAVALVLAFLHACSPTRYIIDTKSEITHIDEKRGFIVIYTPCIKITNDCRGHFEYIPLSAVDFPYLGKILELK